MSLPLGVKGILAFELEATGGPQGGPAQAEIHSSLKAIVDAPAWRLTQALASLTTPDGNTILVPRLLRRDPPADRGGAASGQRHRASGTAE